MADTTPNAPNTMFSPAPLPPANRKLLYAVLAGAVLLLAVIALARTVLNKPAAPEALKPLDAYASSVQLQQIALSEAGKDQTMTLTYVDGVAANTGSKTITGLTVQCIFHDSNGAIIRTETTPLRLIRQREPYVDLEPVSAEPIDPHKSAEFRLSFEGVPDTWDQKPPELHIVSTETRTPSVNLSHP